MDWTNTSDNGDFVAQGATDLRDYNDKFPDTYETNTSGTLYNTTDTYGIAKRDTVYKYYGDNEYMAMLTANDLQGIDKTDWAYPGSQSGGNQGITSIISFDASKILTGENATFRSGKGGKSAPKSSYYRPDMQKVINLKKQGIASFTGNITEQVIDENSNSLWDYLVLNIQITPKAATVYNLVGFTGVLKVCGDMRMGYGMFTTH